MSTGVLKKNVHNVVQELIEKGFTNIEIKHQSHDMYLVFWR